MSYAIDYRLFLWLMVIPVLFLLYLIDILYLLLCKDFFVFSMYRAPPSNTSKFCLKKFVMTNQILIFYETTSGKLYAYDLYHKHTGYFEIDAYVKCFIRISRNIY